jgi:hypothetical protein
VSRICKIIRERCNDIERDNMLANTGENKSLIFYCEIKLEWGKEEYMVCVQEIREMDWCGIWKSSGMRTQYEKGRCPLHRKEEDSIHIFIY